MELNTIIELVKAGFTKDEIMQMEQPTTQIPNPEPVQMEMDIPAPEVQPAPAQVNEPVAVPAPVPMSKPNEPTMAELMQSIAKLTSAVQANAIAQSQLPAGLSTAPKPEDIMAEIIRPTYNGGNKDVP